MRISLVMIMLVLGVLLGFLGELITYLIYV